MKVKELIKILEKLPQDHEVVKKDYESCSDLWRPKEIKYVESSKLENKVLID